MATKRESYQARQDRIRNTIARKIRATIPAKKKGKHGSARIWATVELSDALDRDQLRDMMEYEMDGALDAIMGNHALVYLGRSDRAELNKAVEELRDNFHSLMNLLEDMSDAAINAQDLLE
jgi:hypothetical protein